MAVAATTFFFLYADKKAELERRTCCAPPIAVTDPENTPVVPEGVTIAPKATEDTSTPVATVATSNLYYVAMDDNGKSGTMIGCGDSLVSTPTTLVDANQMAQGLTQMMSAGDYYGQSGLYNPLGAHSSELKLESAMITPDGVALIRFTGSLANVAHCEVPRFQAQVETFAKQFPGVKSVQMEVNGDLFEKLTDERG